MSATQVPGETSGFPQAPAADLPRGDALVHHDGSERYVLDVPDELGGEAVVRVATAAGAAERVYVRYTHDGEPRTVEAEVDEQRDGETWWRVSFPAANPTVRYRFLLSGGDVGWSWLNGTGLVAHEVPGADDFALAVGPRAPAWHAASVVYQIFPDRFARSELYDRAAKPAWALERAWDELPTARGRDSGREWFGGDLRGIEQHLDHVERVGANAIYLTPIFPAGSTHRYDATTFDAVDPLLGGDAAFRSLAHAAQARGIRVLGDLTLNHTGNHHDWFETARRDAGSDERGFYLFDDSLPAGYEAWLGVPTLPKLDWRSPALRDRMGPVARRWLDDGLAGWRIDVANMTGRYRDVDVNHDVARWMRGVAAGTLVVAEHGHDFRPDLDGQGWHGVMNYAGFLRPVWWWLRGDDVEQDVFSSTPAPAYTGRDAVAVMRRFRAGVPWDAVLNSWTLLSSHDTPRFRTVAGSRERHLVGVGLQLTTPGVPMLYAGDELALEGRWGEDGRRPMPWGRADEWDVAFLEQIRRLAALRRSCEALARGGIRYLHVGDDAVAYLRETRDERLLCLAARAAHPPISTPFRSLETLYGGDADDGVLPGDGPAFHVWKIL